MNRLAHQRCHSLAGADHQPPSEAPLSPTCLQMPRTEHNESLEEWVGCKVNA